ncbi:hypothetical protein DKX38_027971 [Salix brachista]|uniref:Histidine-containing phosphotransfer protein n=1 Tax=Salix brachista TaxID=2182728 RepID=A0A5N5J936_9ROSI|nr:hypothetical protein DKX38_027971 [Salix brachista]
MPLSSRDNPSHFSTAANYCFRDGQESAAVPGRLHEEVPGYLDEQFNQLEDLQDEANPNFVEEVVTLFYSDSARFIHNIEQAMINKPNIDYGKLDDYMHQFKGSSSRCIKTFRQLKLEHATLKRKLETYFQLVKQAGIAERR